MPTRTMANARWIRCATAVAASGLAVACGPSPAGSSPVAASVNQGGAAASSGGASTGQATGGAAAAGTGGSVNTVPLGLVERPPNPTCVAAPFPPTAAPDDVFPQTLLATGCFDATDPWLPGPALIPYDVTSELWSDGAEKGRWFAIPDGTTITVAADGDFEFPIGAILVKRFALGSTRLETRLFVRHADGQWGAYTYRWYDNGEARLIEGGTRQIVGDRLWTWPTREECMACHSQAAGRSLGLETRQLESSFAYPNGASEVQLTALARVGFLNLDPSTLPEQPALVDPRYPNSGTLEERARSYLHGNCSHCHRPGGLDGVERTEGITLDLRFGVSLAEMKACGVPPSKETFGVGEMLIAPGNAEASILPFRMASTAVPPRMPQIGTGVVDELGVQVVRDWINSLGSCD